MGSRLVIVGNEATRRREGTTVLPAVFPVVGRDGARVTLRDNYGPRWGREHHGVDIEAPAGSVVRAARAARVERTSGARQHPEMGFYVRTVEPETGLRTWYMHLRRPPLVNPGEDVERSQVLGEVGSTGRSDGPHLHFQWQRGARYIDPYPSLSLAAERVGEHVGSDETTEEETRRRWVTVAKWNARNAAATAADTVSRAWAWPPELLRYVPDPSRARDTMREIRETFQESQRTRMRAYRLARDAGDGAAADAQLEAMANNLATMARNARELATIHDATLAENVARGLTDAEATVREALANVRQVAEETASGIGLGVGIVAALFLFSMLAGRR